MRDLNKSVGKHRVTKGAFGSDESMGNYGAFQIPLTPKTHASVIASDGAETGWEHVSVRIGYRNDKGRVIERTPTWAEMCQIKALFFEPEEVVMQLHPKESEYVNIHNHVLHLWRPENLEIPTPPQILV